MHPVIEQIINKSPHLSWMKDGCLFLTIHGSKAYATNIETSDTDYKGFCCPPKKYFFTTQFVFDQSELSEPDTAIYNIKKFFNLAANANPNILEVLFTDPQDHQIVHPLAEKILDNKQIFLSKRVKASFSGYAYSQLQRIKGHRKYLLHPLKEPPTRRELGLPEKTLIPQDQLLAAQATIQKEIDKFNFDFLENLGEFQKIEIKSIMTEMLASLKLSKEDVWLAKAREIGFDDNFIHLLQREREWNNKKREWDQYQNWKKNRNTERAKDEEKFGIDCFTDDTEFLTDTGFKKFDDITANDKLATVFINQTDHKMSHKKDFGIEYQNYKERFVNIFTGNLYHFYGNHLDVCVTPNHRMLVRPFSRKLQKQGDWQFTTASNIPQTCDFLKSINPNTKNYSNGNVFDNLPISPEDYMKLMGAFLSDGSFAFDKKGPDTISISQKQGNKLHPWMQRFYKKYNKSIEVSLYSYLKNINDFRDKEMTEIVLSIRNRKIINKLYSDCGHHKEKHIPRWVFGLSKRFMEMLLDYMVLGDGSIRNTNLKSITYYTSVKQLADDVQELSVLCGWETSLYGPYKHNYIYNGENKETIMYQVHINKNAPKYDRVLTSNNLKLIPVINARTVCFSVPNETLIVRRNGHISIQGNCKHAYHLVRLMRMCEELLSRGEMIVKRPDREELLFIRNGGWNYDQLIEYAEKQMQICNDLYKTSKILPHSPDIKTIDELCSETIEKYLQL